LKSLTEYKNSLECNPMSEVQLFSERECEQITNSLLEIKNLWQHRYGTVFFSVGALSYLDEGYSYVDNINRYNPILSSKFMWAYDKILEHYQKSIDKPITYGTNRPHAKALPGFHIFQNAEILNQNKWSASIHTDSPETKHVWESEVLEIFTFTISIKSPTELSGLRFWMDTESWNNVSPIYYQECSPDQQNLLEKTALYIPYKTGCIYEHTGDIYHQIATEGNFRIGEMRITLQGHLVELEDAIVVYV
tara:strand:- start:188 stop:934 length:747 start_codon:yes stop_codon:yes gene_type:complete